MYFLSAQPDDYYFLWQLELQLFNFRQMDIPARNIHVVIGYNPECGLRKEFQDLINANQHATFFAYPDNRINSKYLSSIRPHIIKQHFVAYPELNKTPIFYHDSDILFHVLPNFESMINDNIWYVSDARSYLDSRYIKNSSNGELFSEMCNNVGISPETVMSNDKHSGGAQYLMKNTSYEFWDKIEKDSESIYTLLSNHNHTQGEKFYLKTGNPISKYHGIQAWCADMWAVLWNAWLFGHEVKIDPELDFCWPFEKIERLRGMKIIHYAGITDKENEKLFCKTRYIHYPPYYDDFDHIDKSTCSYYIVGLIRDYLLKSSNYQTDLNDVTFLIAVRIDSEDRMENLAIVTKYLHNHFKTNIIVLEADTMPKVDVQKLPTSVEYVFYEDKNDILNHTKYNNILLTLAKTPIISIYDTDVVFSKTQLLNAVNLIRYQGAEYVSPYNGTFVSVDRLFKAMFSKLLDANLLLFNIGKFGIGTRRSFGGAVFLNKNSFVEAGKDNEHIDSWGPEDIERAKRMSILGYKVQRVDGPLFHLPHSRGTNSSYHDMHTRIRLMNEYLRICAMKKDELTEYINTWTWANDNTIKITKVHYGTDIFYQ